MKLIIILAVIALSAMSQLNAQEMAAAEAKKKTSGKEVSVYNPQGRTAVNEAEVPTAVLRAFVDSDFREMAITEVYELTGEALEEIPSLNPEPKPDKLYELMVEDSSRSAILYISENGEIYDAIETV